MLRLTLKKQLFTASKFRITPRNFSSSFLVRSEDELPKSNSHSHTGSPSSGHSHTHNGTPCTGHSHSHNHGVNGQPVKMDKPMLMLAFTCKKCDTRSSHVVSKQAYQDGTVLVQCPGCKSRHLIADHLKIFSDNRITLEDIMKAQGESISSDTSDLVFEDIPESLKSLIGHHAKDAPAEYRETSKSDEPLKLKEKNDD